MSSGLNGFLKLRAYTNFRLRLRSIISMYFCSEFTKSLITFRIRLFLMLRTSCLAKKSLWLIEFIIFR